MGFFSRTKQLGGYVFNFKVGSWMGYSQIKGSAQQLTQITKAVFSPEQAERTETFEQAQERLLLSENELNERRKEFTRLMIIYLLFAIAVFSYSVWIVYAYKNFMGFCMGFGITVYALTYAFRYHFWIYQIKHKKLGCTLRDWFLDKH